MASLVDAASVAGQSVRAELVESAEEYRWSGWSAALAGDKEAIAGLCDLMQCGEEGWEKVGATSGEGEGSAESDAVCAAGFAGGVREGTAMDDRKAKVKERMSTIGYQIAK
jgi:hypothetical protein